MKTKIMRGFTLVELLIVIALIGILAVAVLATINPIEQTNKARDAKFKNDAAEVLSAHERYYASQNGYPWNIGSTNLSTTWVGAWDSTSPHFGVVTTGGGSSGVLVVTSELKGSFMGKEPFVGAVLDTDAMYVVHTGSGSNYVCYIPKANANRTGAVGPQLKCLSGVGDNVTLVDQDTDCVVPTTWTTAISGTTANLLCVPEGNIN